MGPRLRGVWAAWLCSAAIACRPAAAPPERPRHAEPTRRGLLDAARERVDPVHRVVLTARFDPATRTLRGTVSETARNVTRGPLEALMLHRYLEAFRDDGTVFARESEGHLRGTKLVYDGRTRLDALTVDGVPHLARTERSLVPGDHTQLRVNLATPIPPGATFVIETRFAAHLPTLAARAGSLPGFHVLAQWFPKLAVLTTEGFVSTPYHGNGEFFADFARYEVTLDVPTGYAVDGTGDGPREPGPGGLVRHHFIADDVHDAAYAVVRDGSVTTRRCAGVTVRVISPPGYGVAADAHAEATCFGLERLAQRLAPYPYPGLVVIVPPRGADGAAGMEYPRAFVTDGPWFAHRTLAPLGLFETTFHELAHQWFQGIVANDEVTHPLLDEGLASYYGARLAADYVGSERVEALDLVRPFAAARDVPAPDRPAFAYDAWDYGVSIYGRTALVLETFARTFGPESVDAAVRRYLLATAFTHPTPDDLVAAFPEHDAAGPTRALVRATLLDGRLVTSAARAAEVERLGPEPLPIVRRVDGHVDILPGGITATAGACVALDPGAANLLDPERSDQRRCPGERGVPSALAPYLLPFVRWVTP